MSIITASWAAVRPGPMSELGQSRQFNRGLGTSGLPPETDIARAGRHVSKVPGGDIGLEFKVRSGVFPATLFVVSSRK
jgi:hypothetical protein